VAASNHHATQIFLQILAIKTHSPKESIRHADKALGLGTIRQTDPEAMALISTRHVSNQIDFLPSEENLRKKVRSLGMELERLLTENLKKVSWTDTGTVGFELFSSSASHTSRADAFMPHARLIRLTGHAGHPLYFADLAVLLYNTSCRILYYYTMWVLDATLETRRLCLFLDRMEKDV